MSPSTERDVSAARSCRGCAASVNNTDQSILDTVSVPLEAELDRILRLFAAIV